jgi:hypothetical protein
MLLHRKAKAAVCSFQTQFHLMLILPALKSACSAQLVPFHNSVSAVDAWRTSNLHQNAKADVVEIPRSSIFDTLLPVV